MKNHDRFLLIVCFICIMMNALTIVFLNLKNDRIQKENDVMRLELENERNNRLIREIDPRAVNF